MDVNIYFKKIPLFEKKIRFCENHTHFFLKKKFFFNLVLLHLNNHSREIKEFFFICIYKVFKVH